MTSDQGTRKGFFRGVAKVVVIIVVSILALAAVGYAVQEFKEAAARREAKPFESVKIWSPTVHESLAMKISARTKLIDGTLYAAVHGDGYPQYLATLENANRLITLEFRDRDDFKVFEKSIRVREFTRIIGPEGKPSGIAFEFSEYVGLNSYQRWANSLVGWTVETKSTTPLAQADDAEEKPTLDHCAPGLSKAERLKRLAQHGNVRQTGDSRYSAGRHAVSFFSYDGSLLGCN